MWFENLMGFTENDPKTVRNKIYISYNKLVSKVNQKEYFFGKLITPSLNELRQEFSSPVKYNSRVTISEIIGNVQLLHCDQSNNGAFFQAASQFNLLEMTSPMVTPEKGVGIYENDFTQGPACAISCGGLTPY